MARSRPPRAEVLEVIRKEFLDRFNIASYAATREFDLRAWHFALSRRRHLIDYSMHDRDKVVGSLLALWDSPLLAQPLGGHERLTARSVIDVDMVSAWSFRDAIRDHAPTVKVACEAWDIRTNTAPPPIDPSLVEGSDEWWRVIRDEAAAANDEILFSSFNEVWLRDDGQFSNLVYAEVNLEAPDSTVIEDFKRWLADKRQDARYPRAPVAELGELDLARWAQKRVLAYIDIKLLSNVFGLNLSNHQIGALIYPDIVNIDVAERVRKSVAPLADLLLSYEMLEALREAANSSASNSEDS